MTSSGRNEDKLARTQSQVLKRVERSEEHARAELRLQHIHEISKLLLGSRDLTATVSQVIKVLASSLPLTHATFTEGLGPQRTVHWPPLATSGAESSPASIYAQALHDYLMGSPGSRASCLIHVVASPATRKKVVVLPLAVDPHAVFGSLQLESSVPFDESDLLFVDAVVNQLALAIERRELVDATEREQRLLAEVGDILTSSLDRRATLAAVARRMVPQFADLCLVDEVSSEGRVERAHVVFADEAKQRRLSERVKEFAPRTAWKTPQARVLESGRPLLYADITDPAAQGIAQDAEHAAAMCEVGLRSMMVLPLRARGRKLGVLTFVTAESGRKYGLRELANAVRFAERLATGLDNAWLYEQAQTATRARDDLLAIVSHDLKNPLGSILMSANLMLALPAGEDRRASRRHPELIVRAVHRMNRLIIDLLDVASIEDGHLTVSADTLRVEPLVSEALDAMLPAATSKGVVLRGDVATGVSEVCGDGVRLQQVFSNLIGNAIKFTPRGGTVILRAVPAGGRVTFSVLDTGPGIPHHELPHLFERFWQARRTAKLGTGLGLFIVQGIVRAHGGEVWVESTLGEGSSFFFTVPASPCSSQSDEDSFAPEGERRERASKRLSRSSV